jgi:serine phosphatase RsbU (regulator of sigma subunit)
MNMALLLYTVEVGPRGGLQLRLSGGGIPPAYIVRAAGAVEEIAVAGLPLGAVPDAEYRIRTAHLSTGDTVLLMSDGLPERLSPENEQLGYEAVERWLRLELDRQWPAATIVERLLDLGAAWSQEGVADDDETFVVMKVL